MARTSETVTIRLHELMLLLSYRWAAVNSLEVGELGSKAHEELLTELDNQCDVVVKPAQLADLIYHMKEVIFERVNPAKVDHRVMNHNKIMRRLKAQVPHLFKEGKTGEIVMVDYEDRLNV